MNSIKYRLFFIGLGIAGVLDPVYEAQALSVTPVVSLSYPGAAVNSNTGYNYPSHSLVYGGGAIFGFTILPNFMAQLGGLYGVRGFDESASSLSSQYEVSMTTLQVPFTFHYFPLPAVGVGLGAYYSYAFGSASVYPVGSPSSSTAVAYGAGGYVAQDYGAVASVSFRLGIISVIHLVLDCRYLYGLQNVSNINGTTAYLRDFQLLGGLQFGK